MKVAIYFIGDNIEFGLPEQIERDADIIVDMSDYEYAGMVEALKNYRLMKERLCEIYGNKKNEIFETKRRMQDNQKCDVNIGKFTCSEGQEVRTLPIGDRSLSLCRKHFDAELVTMIDREQRLRPGAMTGLPAWEDLKVKE